MSPEQTVTVQINTEEDQKPTQPKFSSGSDKELYLWSPCQTATVGMSLGELIAWEKKYAGQYSEIRLVE